MASPIVGAHTTVFSEPVSGASVSIPRAIDLRNTHRIDHQQDILESDDGRQSVFSRKIRRRLLTASFTNLSHQQAAEIEDFYDLAVKESCLKFSMTGPSVLPLSIQAGDPIAQTGLPLQCGELLKTSKYGQPEAIQCGRRYRLTSQDTISGLRFVKGSFQTIETKPKNVAVSFSLVQEL